MMKAVFAVVVSALGLSLGATTYTETKTYSFDGSLSGIERWKYVSSSSSCTVSGWIKVTGMGQGTTIAPRIFNVPNLHVHVGAATGAYDGYHALTAILFPNGDETGISWTIPHCLPMNQWVHIAVSFGPAERDGMGAPVVYVNGVSYRDELLLKEGYVPGFGGGYVYLGNTSRKERPFQGEIANVRYDTTVLSDETVASLAVTAPDGQAPAPVVRGFADDLPVVDLTGEVARQTVVCAGTADRDTGHWCHPSTLLSPDGKTLYCTWTLGHGGKCGPMAKSVDGGVTWTRLDSSLPSGYAAYVNCPTFQLTESPSGGYDFAVYAQTAAGTGTLLSRDEGVSWSIGTAVSFGSSGMPPTGYVALKNGKCAIFGQNYRNDGSGEQYVAMALSSDGGATFAAPKQIASVVGKDLCEPFAIRSPDGSEIAVLMRENSHRGRSMVMFSSDEGVTWTTPVDTCFGLTGDRHEGVLLPDGRLFVAMRDKAIDSSTFDQYVAWVGTWADLKTGAPGQCRVHLLKDYAGGRCGGFSGDNGYSGVELLPDGTLVCTTYLRYWNDDRWNSIVATRIPYALLPPPTSPVTPIPEKVRLLGRWKMDVTETIGALRRVPCETAACSPLRLTSPCVLTEGRGFTKALSTSGTSDGYLNYATYHGEAVRDYSFTGWIRMSSAAPAVSGNVYPRPFKIGSIAEVQLSPNNDDAIFRPANGTGEITGIPFLGGKDVWSHFAITASYSGSGDAWTETLKFYRNGMLAKTVVNGLKSRPATLNRGDRIFIGSANLPTRAFAGDFDDLRLYAGSIPDGQIAQLAAERPELIGQWKMESVESLGKSRAIPCESDGCSALLLDDDVALTNSWDATRALWSPGTAESYCNHASVNGANGVRDVTVALWVNQSSLAATPAVSGNVYPRLFKVGGVGELQFSPSQTGALYYPANGTGNINGIPLLNGNDVWSHIAVTAAYVYDGERAKWTETLKFFRDGAVVKTVVNALASAPKTLNRGDEIYLASANMPNRAFTGAIDDVRIYAGALADEDVAVLYRTPPRLIGHWKMDTVQGSGANRSVPCETAECSALCLDDDIILTNGVAGSRAIYSPGTRNSYLNYASYVGEGDIRDFTFAGWINQSSLSATPAVSGNIYPRAFKVGTICEVQLRTSVADTLSLLRPGNGLEEINNIPFLVGKDVWSHFAISGKYAYDSASGKWREILTVYLNGSEQYSAVKPLAGTPATIVSGQKVFLASADNPDRPLTGALDDIRLYAGALTADEVKAVYSSCAEENLPGSVTDGLMFHWTFDGAAFDRERITGTKFTKSGEANQYFVPGKVGNGVRMSDAKGYLTTGLTALPGEAGGTAESACQNEFVTVSAWVWIDSLSESECFRSAVVGKRYTFALRYKEKESGRWGAQHKGFSIYQQGVGGTVTLCHYPDLTAAQKDRWLHVCAVVDRKSGTAMEMWYDGVRQTAVASTAGAGGRYNAKPLTIGGEPYAEQNTGNSAYTSDYNVNYPKNINQDSPTAGQYYSNAFPGVLDDIRLYSRRLSRKEILLLADIPPKSSIVLIFK